MLGELTTPPACSIFEQGKNDDLRTCKGDSMHEEIPVQNEKLKPVITECAKLLDTLPGESDPLVIFSGGMEGRQEIFVLRKFDGNKASAVLSIAGTIEKLMEIKSAIMQEIMEEQYNNNAGMN